MRREIIVVLVFMLAVSSLTIISNNASAQIKKEDMTWSTGDQWEYRYTVNSGETTTIFKMTVTVDGEDNIEIDGTNYDVITQDLTGDFENIDTNVLNTTLAQGSTIYGTSYLAKDNDETAKTIQHLKYQLINDSGKFLNFTQTVISITTATSGVKPDVIDVGTSWTSTVKTITTTTTNYSGNFYDELFQQQNYSNTTTSTNNRTDTINYECISKKNVTTDAGTFETYEIRRSIVGGQGVFVQYISSSVKNDVEDITYDSDGNMISMTELISYDVTPPITPQPTQKTPGFELAIVIFGITLILYLRRKKAN